MSLLVLSGDDVDAITPTFSTDELVELMARVFVTLSRSSSTGSNQTTAGTSTSVTIPHRSIISTTNHRALFMPARLSVVTPSGSESSTAIKIVSVPTPAAPIFVQDRGLQATTIVLDEDTGDVKAIVNARKLTALRNAAS